MNVLRLKDLDRERFGFLRDDHADGEWLSTPWMVPVHREAILVEQYWPMARKIGRKFMFSRAARHLAMDHDDLVQLAWVGILRGIRTYREGQAASMTTWVWNNATWMCSALMTRVYERWQRLGRQPLTLTNLEESTRDDAMPIWDVLLPDRGDTGDALAEAPMQMVTVAVGILRARNKHRLADIMEMRVGDGRTLQECADMIGVTRERVRQLQNKAAQILIDCPEWRAAWRSYDPAGADPVYRPDSEPQAQEAEPR